LAPMVIAATLDVAWVIVIVAIAEPQTIPW
jgi:hypothetical protein